MGTRIGGFIGFSTAASATGARGVWNADSQSYFMRKGEAFWPVGESVGAIIATGGTIETPGNGYRYHYYTSSGTFNVASGGGSGVVYIVGGGGGGGHNSGGAGGGGAGGMRTVPTIIGVGNFSIVVGAGGQGPPAYAGGEAGSPAAYQGGLVGTASTITSVGGQALKGIYASGGGGGIVGQVPATYSLGGSGGGDSAYRVVESNPAVSPGPGLPSNAGNLGGFSPPEGNRGGWTSPGSISPNYGGSGGGGAGGVGGAGNPSTAGSGGDGAAFADPAIPSSYGTPGPDGALRYFAGGGGGGTYTSGTTPQAFGGGGMGGARASIGAAHNPDQDGDVNTGGGGGGMGDNVGTSGGSGKGGSGFVCIRYAV